MAFDLVRDTSPSEKLVILALACREVFAYSNDNRENIIPTITRDITEPTKKAQWYIKAAVRSLEEQNVVRVYYHRQRPHSVQLYVDPPPAVLVQLEVLQQKAREVLGFSPRSLEPMLIRFERHRPHAEQVHRDCVFAFERLFDESVPMNADHGRTVYILSKPMAVLKRYNYFLAKNRCARRTLYYLQALGLLEKHPIPNAYGEEIYSWLVVPGHINASQLIALATGPRCYETHLLDQHRREAGVQ